MLSETNVNEVECNCLVSFTKGVGQKAQAKKEERVEGVKALYEQGNLG